MTNVLIIALVTISPYSAPQLTHLSVRVIVEVECSCLFYGYFFPADDYIHTPLFLLQGVNIFVDKDKLDRQIEGGAEDEDGAPEISLAEMMEDLDIDDDPMGDGGDDGDDEELE